jgi:hypothetical protein
MLYGPPYHAPLAYCVVLLITHHPGCTNHYLSRVPRPRFRNGTRSVAGSLTDPGGHGHGSLFSGNLFMHCNSY